VNQDVGQFQILSSPNVPLSGNDPTTSATVHTSYGGALFYDTIPYEFLFTAETEPQIMVSVNGLPAVCASLSCGYSYTVLNSIVTSFTRTGTALTINGNYLPTTDFTVIFGQTACTGGAATANQITCTLENDPVSGDWVPEVRTANGLVRLHSSVNAQNVAITATSITPNTNVNPMGGSTLTIAGSNFPVSLDTLPADFSLSF